MVIVMFTNALRVFVSGGTTMAHGHLASRHVVGESAAEDHGASVSNQK